MSWTPRCPSCDLHKDELEPGHFAPFDASTGTWSCPNGGNVTTDAPAKGWFDELRGDA